MSIWGDLVRQEFEHANGAYSWKSEDVPNLLDALILQGTCVKAALLQYESEKSDMASLTIVLSQDEALARLLVQGVTLEISLSDPQLNWQTTVEVDVPVEIQDDELIDFLSESEELDNQIEEGLFQDSLSADDDSHEFQDPTNNFGGHL